MKFLPLQKYTSQPTQSICELKKEDSIFVPHSPEVYIYSSFLVYLFSSFGCPLQNTSWRYKVHHYVFTMIKRIQANEKTGFGKSTREIIRRDEKAFLHTREIIIVVGSFDARYTGLKFRKTFLYMYNILITTEYSTEKLVIYAYRENYYCFQQRRSLC